MPAVHIPPIQTRLHSYRIVRKKREVQYDSGQAVDLSGVSAPSRASVNNCTEAKNSPILSGRTPTGPGPEQFEIGQLTCEQRKQIKESLHNHKLQRQKSPAGEFEALAIAITIGDCSDYDKNKAGSYLKAAHEIKQSEQVLSLDTVGLAGLVQQWAQLKKV